MVPLVKPTIFYKYTTASTAESILKNSRLRWSSPNLFNDLAEFQRIPRFVPSVNEAYRLLPKVLIDAANGTRSLHEARLLRVPRQLLARIKERLGQGETEAELVRDFNKLEWPDADHSIERQLRDHFEALDKKTARVLCLTSKFDNDVMWGTYTKSHSGCVFGFKAAAKDSPFHEARPVAYTDEPIAGSGLDFLLYGNSLELRRKTIEAVFYSKKTVWSYEQEWRLITWRKEEAEASHGDYRFFPEELASITFGARATSADIDGLCEIARVNFPNTALYQITHNNGDLKRMPLKQRGR